MLHRMQAFHTGWFRHGTRRVIRGNALMNPLVDPLVDPSGRRGKQVRLTGFNNEPMAKLAEQVLKQQGIPCFTRSLQGGPGLWGSAYNLPHDISVYQEDEARAREALELPPLDPDQAARRSETVESSRNRRMLILGIVIAVLATAIIMQSIGG